MEPQICVLLVDDDEVFREEMSKQLEEEGFRVELASNGPEALSKARLLNASLDVAVIDHFIGPPNGIEIMLQIRLSCPSVEAIILTGYGKIGPGERALEEGAYRYLPTRIPAHDLAFEIRAAARFGYQKNRILSLEALVSAGQKLGTAKSEDELYEKIFKEASRLLPGLNGFLISRYDSSNGIVSFPYGYSKGQRISLPPRTDGNSITEYVLRTRRPLLLPTGDVEFRRAHRLNAPFHNVDYCASEIAVPMFYGDEVVGTINALTYEPSVRFSQDQLQVLQSFANQAVVAMLSVQQLVEAQELRDVALSLAGKRGVEQVLQGIVEGAHYLLASDYTGLMLLESDGTLRKVKPVIPAESYGKFDEPRQFGGVTRWVVETRQPRIIPDTSADPLVKETVRKLGVRSMLAFPLIWEDRILGVLYGHTFSPRFFTSHDIGLWTAFASQSAAALGNTIRDEERTQSYARLQSELNPLADKMDLATTKRQVATAAKRVFAADSCGLALVVPATGKITLGSWADGDADQYSFEGAPRENGVTRYVIRTKLPVFRVVDDTAEVPLPHPDLVAKGLKALASIPLIYAGRVIGVLHCNFFTKTPEFDEEFRTLAVALGARAAIALNRAYQDHVGEIWRDLDRQIATCASLSYMYRIFAEHAHQALGADVSVFYPYDPTSSRSHQRLIQDGRIIVGELHSLWQPAVGGHGGRVVDGILRASNGTLIVNDLQGLGGPYSSDFSAREHIGAFVAVRLDVQPEAGGDPQLAGILFLNYRHTTAIEQADLTELQSSALLVAAGILRLHLQSALQDAANQQRNQLRALVETLKVAKQQGSEIGLDFFAEQARAALSIDHCMIFEYAPNKGKLLLRGQSGLDTCDSAIELPEGVITTLMNSRDAVVISGAELSQWLEEGSCPLLRGLESTVVYSLRTAETSLGLFFAGYRVSKAFSSEELEAFGYFADLAALELHDARLGAQLNDIQQRLHRRLFLTDVSILQDSWRHSLVPKASSIQNYAAVLRRQVAQNSFPTSGPDGTSDIISEIDRLATEIANAPPRLPQSWELNQEMIPLASMLREVVDRENRPFLVRMDPPIKIEAEVGGLEGCQVWGYRRLLIFLLESLFQNAVLAMPNGGVITVIGSKVNDWAEIRIRDTGTGVPASVQPFLFKKEVLSSREKSGGMRFGSLLASTIVEEHEGEIGLEQPGPGDTTVLVRLPVLRKD